MPYFCTPCGRPFDNEDALKQHLRHAKAHRTPVHGPPQPRNPPPKNPPQSTNRPEITSSHQPRPSQPEISSLSYVGTTRMVSRPFQTRPTPPQNRPRGQQNTSTNHHPSSHISNGTMSYVPRVTATAALSNVIPSWSSTFPVSEHEATLDALSAQCHSLTDLKDYSYITHLYDPEEYKNKQKCQRCYGREYKVSNQPCVFHSFKRNKYNAKKPYRCCNTIDGQGCQTLPKHDFRLSLRAISHQDFLPTPSPTPSKEKLKAVVFDCEMAGIASGAGETILLCATDYLTGQVILHSFVNPTGRITQMRDEVHGISKQTLNTAISQGKALLGWEGARAELWKFIDADTILIGHALQNDLDALRMIHHRIVDSGIMARKTVGINRIQWSLLTLCDELLHQEIRKSKGKIHECLEDVMATREVVLFCTRQREEFLDWAKKTSIRELALEAEREKLREEKKKADLNMKKEEAKKIASMTIAERASYLSRK